MVNTFLVRSDYSESARLLDRARLGKQRVEAFQILNALKQLRLVAQLLGLPDFPVNQETPLETRLTWIRSVVTTFNKFWTALWIRDRLQIWIPKSVPGPRKLTSDFYLDPEGYVWEYKSNQILWKGRVSECILPGDIYITMGWKSHPATRMWLGLEPSLKMYINAHIKEWIRRGYSNTLELYPEDKSACQPSWTREGSSMILGCKANLLYKELTRKESPWYIQMIDFQMALQHMPNPEYFWM